MTLYCEKVVLEMQVFVSLEPTLDSCFLSTTSQMCFLKGFPVHFLITSALPRTYYSAFSYRYSELHCTCYLIYTKVYFIWFFWSYPYLMLRPLHFLYFLTSLALPAYSIIILTNSPETQIGPNLLDKTLHILSRTIQTLEPWQPSLQIHCSYTEFCNVFIFSWPLSILC